MDPSCAAEAVLGIERDELANPSVGRSRGSFRCLEPLSPVGLGRGRFEFCALPYPWFLTTRGAELCRLPRSLRLE